MIEAYLKIIQNFERNVFGEEEAKEYEYYFFDVKEDNDVIAYKGYRYKNGKQEVPCGDYSNDRYSYFDKKKERLVRHYESNSFVRVVIPPEFSVQKK